MSSPSDETDSRPDDNNGDYDMDEETQEPDDAEDDSDLDLSKDIQPISFYTDNRDELFKQVLDTLGPEGRLEALIPEILTVLPRLELEQLCLENLRMMSSKKLRMIMEGLDINDMSDDDEEVIAEVTPKWKPLQDEGANFEAEEDEENEENGVSRSGSRSSSKSSVSSRSGSRRKRHRDRHHRRRSSHHRRRRHGHGSSRRRHRHSRERRHRRHRRKSESESEHEEADQVDLDETSTKSGSTSMQAAVPIFYDPNSNMMIPVIPANAVNSVAAASSVATSAAPFVTGASGFVDSPLVAALGVPTLPTVAGVPLISSTGYPPVKKSQYDVSIDDDEDLDGLASPTNASSKLFQRRMYIKTESNRVPISSSLNVLPAEESLKKPELALEIHRESTPPPPGTDDLQFENNNIANGLDEPAPPGTAEIAFS